MTTSPSAGSPTDCVLPSRHICGAINLANRRLRAHWNADTFRLISAGKNGRFGIGGQWAREAKELLPLYAEANKLVTGQTLGTNARQVERDNLTNFSGGKLN